MPKLYQLSSSLRELPVDETLRRARALASTLGITRVTNTTYLDKIGIPVYSSIRPTAKPGSLCVNAGKGLRDEEAQAGAYMEAIEFALAEYDSNKHTLFPAGVDEIMASISPDLSLFDLCPRYGCQVRSSERIACVEGVELLSGKSVVVPAELVFVPFRENPGPHLFGASTNGLSSGNSLLEATVHGLAEVIERDVQSFNYIIDGSSYVPLTTLPTAVTTLVDKIQASGLQVVLRFSFNPFGLPYFQAHVLENSDVHAVSIATGTGLHPLKEVAAVRAICEAAQSRVVSIHGGRDDLVNRVDLFNKLGRSMEIKSLQQTRRYVTNQERKIEFSDIPDFSSEILSMTDALDVLVDRLRRVGILHVLRYDLSRHDHALSIVKIVVPKLEFFEAVSRRVGRRLIHFIQNAPAAELQSHLKHDERSELLG